MFAASTAFASLALATSVGAQDVRFVDVGPSVGILSHEAVGGFGSGVAAGDYDEDADNDLFVPTGDGTPNRLYRNQANGTFVEVAALVGLADTERTRAGLWFDADSDGRVDLLTLGDCHAAPAACPTARTTKFYRQELDGTFTDVTASAGLELAIPASADRHVGGAAAADVDGDGDLDLFITDWRDAPSTDLDGSRLFLNSGTGTFTDATVASGIAASQAKRWQPVFVDFDDDGDLDLFSAVDFSVDQLWLNTGGGQFVDASVASGAASGWTNFGVAPGDPDNDGDVDLYVTNVEPPAETAWSILLRNVSIGTTLAFEEIATAAGLRGGSWGWGATWIDADNDGWQDLAHTNGFNGAGYDVDASHLYLNAGTVPPTFTDATAGSGFEDTDWGSGLIAFDYDRDGRDDLIQVTNNPVGPSPFRLLHNVSLNPGNHNLVVAPRMDGPNSLAIGATVRVTVDGRTTTRVITAGTSFFSQEPAEAHFGLGTATQADSVRVDWPNGGANVLVNVAADQVVVVTPASGSLDSDGDGLLDDVEISLATNPSLRDSDGDGVRDRVEVGDILAPTDTDQDSSIDALDPDDDGDGIPTLAEDTNANGNSLDDDVDDDGSPNYRDLDSDGDGFPDAQEVAEGSDPYDPLSTPIPSPPVPMLGPWGLSALGLLLAGVLANRAGRRGR